MVRNTTGSAPLPFVDPNDVDKFAIFASIGHTPDEWQRIAHEAALKYRYVNLACGVRVGKTHFAIAEATAAAVTPSIKSREVNEWVGSRVWIVAPTYDLADRVFLPVLRNLKRHYPFLITSASERDRVIYLVGGGIVQAKTAENKDSLVGEELDLLVLEECARIGEEEKEMAEARLLTRRGRRIAISSPTSVKWFMRDFDIGQANGFHYEFTGEPADGCKYAGRQVRFVRNAVQPDPDSADYFSVRIPTHANPRLSVRDLARAERKMPERLFRQDFLAEFVGKTGTVFRDFESRLIPQNEALRVGHPGRLYALGWDPARTMDWSVVSVWDFTARRQVFMDRFRGDWEYQYGRVVATCYRFNAPYVAVDATGKGDAVAENLKVKNIQAGDPAFRATYPRGQFARLIEPVTTYSNAEKRALVESFQAAVENGDARMLDYPEQTQEHRLFEYDESETTKVVRYGAPKGFHDDTVMANTLAWRLMARPLGTSSFLIG